MFLERVAALISSHGITRNKLLHDLDLDKNSFFNWEKRGTIPSGEVLAKIADYFGVPLSYLLHGQIIFLGRKKNLKEQ